ncbi:MAG TPA: hypothetical protein VH021_02645, partial [Trebonia sp.]|nr:hypothetical protein [Trebonia sp.]
MRAKALIAGGLLAALTAIVVSGCAAGTGDPASASAAKSAASSPAGSTAGCTIDAYRSIRAHQRLASVPAACRALTPSQRNEAVGLAIRMASGTGSKSEWRRQARAAAAYVSALITGPAPTLPAPTVPAPTVPAPSAGGVAAPAASRLGFSESATEVAALLAWLATAGSGGWILIRWRRAGGRLARPRG